ncbi:hypothetical protein C805_03575 [Eubacterium sp. 14-2]|uniref:phosphatase PAP2 family protein n=1 Tax=Eubacterium sp. 14-2 TaxID=1235790 RepID=UPI00033F4BED|nr:phosphatase PAP2 family protein [Eubacterium sp. 14-2]EOT22255.1 hypothetical protein C805_03575 [Eubacterium sp. 14-2]
MRKKIQIIPGIMWLPLIITLVCNTIAYNGTRLFMSDKVHYNLSNGLDDRIPFVPWTVAIYLGCYVFWVVNYIIGCRQDREEAFRFLSADLLTKLVCFLCFLFLPTTNTRPVIEGSTIWDELMRFLYQVDAADNLFPSIHCLTSWFCFIAVRRNEKIPKWYRLASLLMALSVCISTLTTKQHVLIDVAAGIGIAEGSYWFVEKCGFSGWYMNFILKAESRMGRKKLQTEK